MSVLLKYILKPGSFSHKILDKSCLKVGKTKKSEFQKFYVRRSGNRKHGFFITWIFYQLTTELCSNYGIQLNQMSDICEILKN